MKTVTRRCPVCGRQIELTEKGWFRRHSTKALAVRHVKCPGSGLLPGEGF